MVLVLLAQGLAYYAAGRYVSVHKRSDSPIDRTPGNAIGSNEKVPLCPYLKSTFKETWDELHAFNKEHGWLRLHIPARSREGDAGEIILDTWYLESPNGTASSPTIVVVHGTNKNNNDQTVMGLSSMARMMGYNVLIPSMRNHGNSTHTGSLAFGATEAFDVLGVWDYAVNDPDGLLKGKKDPKDTAVAGFSLGGLVATIAFAMEPKIPSLLLDGGMWDARLTQGLLFDKMIFPGFTAILGSSCWFWTEWISGEDIDAVSPAELLKKEGDSRKISIAHGQDDTWVPFRNQEDRMAFIEDTDYDIVSLWTPSRHFPEGEAEGCMKHCRMMAAMPKKYKAFLCGHFSNVFGTTSDECGGTGAIDGESGYEMQGR
jgi:pimeloyl-ACP methyl ester carboxylesterase